MGMSRWLGWCAYGYISVLQVIGDLLHLSETVLSRKPLVEPEEGSEVYFRPAWQWILTERIEPLCAVFGLIIAYEDETDESCAIFYTDEWREA